MDISIHYIATYFTFECVILAMVLIFVVALFGPKLSAWEDFKFFPIPNSYSDGEEEFLTGRKLDLSQYSNNDEKKEEDSIS